MLVDRLTKVAFSHEGGYLQSGTEQCRERPGSQEGSQILAADGALVEVDHPPDRPDVAANTSWSARLSIDSKGGAPIWPLSHELSYREVRVDVGGCKKRANQPGGELESSPRRVPEPTLRVVRCFFFAGKLLGYVPGVAPFSQLNK